MPPRLARLLAALVALAMIGGALWYSQRDSGSKSSSGPGSTAGPTSTGTTLRIVCVTELAEVCQAVEAAHRDVRVTVADAGATAATLATADPAKPPFDAWLTLAPWPATVDAQRVANGTGSALFGSSAVATVAHTPLSAVMPADRLAALRDACGATLSWSCVADHAGDDWAKVDPSVPAAATWGTFKIGLGDPDSALGRALLGQAVASIAAAHRLGSDYGTDDFSPYLLTLKALVTSADPQASADQLTDLLNQPGKYSLVAGDAPSASRATTSPRGVQRGLQAISLTPAARADAQVAILGPASAAKTLTALFTDKTGTAAFDTAGWQPGAPQGADGLPAADVLAALREKIT